MKLPAPLKWFRWIPKFEPFKRPEFPVDYVLKKRQEAAAETLRAQHGNDFVGQLAELAQVRRSLADAVRSGDKEEARRLTAIYYQEWKNVHKCGCAADIGKTGEERLQDAKPRLSVVVGAPRE